MPIYHNKHKTTQPKIRERESPQITINTRHKFHNGYGFGLEQSEGRGGGEGEEGEKLEVMGSV